MAGWNIAQSVRLAQVDQQARRFLAYVEASNSLKEAAWLARIPERTARRYRRRMGL